MKTLLAIILTVVATLQLATAQAQTVSQADMTGFSSYAGLYVTSGSAVTTSTNAATYTPLLFTGTGGAVTASFNAVASSTNSQIQVNMTGQYSVGYSMSIQSSATNTTIRTAPFVDSTELTNCGSALYVTGTNVVQMSGQGIFTVTSVTGTTGIVKLQVKSDATSTITPTVISLTVRRISN